MTLEFELRNPELPGRIRYVSEGLHTLEEVIRQGYLPGHISPEDDASLRVRYQEAASAFARQAMTVLAHPVIAGGILEEGGYDSTWVLPLGYRYPGITPRELGDIFRQEISFSGKNGVPGFRFEIKTQISRSWVGGKRDENRYAAFCGFVRDTYPSPVSNEWQFSLDKNGQGGSDSALGERNLEPTDLARDPGLMVCFISWASRRISRLIQQLDKATMRQEDAGRLERLVNAFEGAQNTHTAILEELRWIPFVLPEPGPHA